MTEQNLVTPLLCEDVVVIIVQMLCAADMKSFMCTSKVYLKMIDTHPKLCEIFERAKSDQEGWNKIIEQVETHWITFTEDDFDRPHQGVEFTQFVQKFNKTFVLQELSLLPNEYMWKWLDNYYQQRLYFKLTETREVAILLIGAMGEKVVHVFHDRSSIIHKYARWQTKRSTRRYWRLKFEINLSPFEKQWVDVVHVYQEYEPVSFYEIAVKLNIYCDDIFEIKTNDEICKQVLDEINKNSVAKYCLIVGTFVFKKDLGQSSFIILMHSQIRDLTILSLSKSDCTNRISQMLKKHDKTCDKNYVNKHLPQKSRWCGHMRREGDDGQSGLGVRAHGV